jgi:hypothetical protein
MSGIGGVLGLRGGRAAPAEDGGVLRPRRCACRPRAWRPSLSSTRPRLRARRSSTSRGARRATARLFLLLVVVSMRIERSVGCSRRWRVFFRAIVSSVAISRSASNIPTRFFLRRVLLRLRLFASSFWGAPRTFGYTPNSFWGCYGTHEFAICSSTEDYGSPRASGNDESFLRIGSRL